jgi:hypothetical protein
VVQVDDEKTTELVAAPVGKGGVAQRSLEPRHDHGADLLVEGKAARTERCGAGW